MKWIMNYVVGVLTFLLCSIGLIGIGALLAVFAPIITLFIIDE